MPLIANGESDDDREKNTLSNGYRMLDSELEVLYSLNDSKDFPKEDSELAKEMAEENMKEGETQEEQIDRTVETASNVETRVISENNIEASFTDSSNDIQIKNQSKYDVTELIGNSNYELKNKNKVIIYHTHTCESYTSSEKYNYEMTGTYRTTDLNYTVSKVRR